MEFEYLSLIAEITTEESAQYAVIGLISGGVGWVGMYMVKPWFGDWLESRKLDREARRKREDAIAQAQIDEIKHSKEADDKLFERLVQQGKDETAHMNLLTAQGRVQEQIMGDVRNINDTLQDIYNRLGVDRHERIKPIRQSTTDGQSTSK